MVRAVPARCRSVTPRWPWPRWLVVVACGSDAGRSATTGPSATSSLSAMPSSPSPGVSASPGPTVGPSASSLPRPTGSFDPAALSIRLEPVVRNLNSPLAVVSTRDGSGRLFVVEQPGRIRIVRNGAVVDPPFLNIIPRVSSGGERGLLGLAFAPGYPADPRFFVDYTDTSGNTVISSFTVPAATPDQADPDSERVLLQVDQPFPNHNGGALAFGPDGDLYIGMGDGGSGGDPLGNGQSLTTLLAKILRIRPSGPDATGPGYTIPPDNPFANDASARPEIFAYGLRNPWRLSFDRATGDLWIGDVGQGAWEEVDRWPAGHRLDQRSELRLERDGGSPLLQPGGQLHPDRARRAGRRVRPWPGLCDRRWLRRVATPPSPRSTAAMSSATTARATSGSSTQPIPRRRGRRSWSAPAA